MQILKCSNRNFVVVIVLFLFLCISSVFVLILHVSSEENLVKIFYVLKCFFLNISGNPLVFNLTLHTFYWLQQNVFNPPKIFSYLGTVISNIDIMQLFEKYLKTSVWVRSTVRSVCLCWGKKLKAGHWLLIFHLELQCQNHCCKSLFCLNWMKSSIHIHPFIFTKVIFTYFNSEDLPFF